MSPTEDQLRRALQDGQGAGPDPDLVLQRAVAYRSQRRVRIASTVAVVALVAGIGTGIGIVASRPARHNAGSSTALSPRAADKAGNAPQNASGYAAGGAASAPQATPACPTTMPAIGTGSGSGDLYPQPVVSVTVCGYLGTGVVVRDSRTGQPLTRTFNGADATAIAQALNTAPKVGGNFSCKAVPATGLHRLLLLAQYATGAAAPSVAVGTGCDASVTNGVEAGFDVASPAPLRDFVTVLQQAAQSPYQLPKPAPSPATT